MFLSIIIPYHNEEQETINPLLNSINSQIGINFNDIEIIIVNDCEDVKYVDTEHFANITNIRQIKSSHYNNPGLSRQTGLDNAAGDYVMFCDSDDLLASCLVLRDSFSFMSNLKVDIYSLNFLEEQLINNRFEYFTKGQNITWVFSKIYSKKFLQDNNIRFSKELLYHEDSYFNGLCVGCKATMSLIPITGYIWKYNEQSITRRNNHEYTCKSCAEHIKSIELVQDKYAIRGLKTQDTQRILLQFFGLMYHNIHTLFKTSQYRSEIEQSFASLILKHDPNLICLEEKARPIINLGIQQNFIPTFAPDEIFEHFILRVIGKEVK